jgi:hypothetical protein
VEEGVSGSTRDFMKAEPNPSNEVLAGRVERVTYQNAENGFCVIRVKVRGHREHHHCGVVPPRLVTQAA